MPVVSHVRALVLCQPGSAVERTADAPYVFQILSPESDSPRNQARNQAWRRSRSFILDPTVRELVAGFAVSRDNLTKLAGGIRRGL
jgi:hypothetical protein